MELEAEYTVYGLTLREGCFWYYICDRFFTYFPRWKPSPFFEVIDSRLSRYWIYCLKKADNYSDAYPIITFPEWANNHPEFYDRLSDGEDQEVAIFRSYKERMDLEFPNSSIVEIAKIVDAEWLICSFCIDAWKSNTSLDALVCCPACKKIMQNPRYKNEIPHL
ncbi:MAG: hypothetical protein JSR93_01145 [Verrucomicrobia bacterium]|nr:hypothetical protein [Verrucomicrobiota bacterium]